MKNYPKIIKIITAELENKNRELEIGRYDMKAKEIEHLNNQIKALKESMKAKIDSFEEEISDSHLE